MLCLLFHDVVPFLSPKLFHNALPFFHQTPKCMLCLPLPAPSPSNPQQTNNKASKDTYPVSKKKKDTYPPYPQIPQSKPTIATNQ